MQTVAFYILAFETRRFKSALQNFLFSINNCQQIETEIKQ